MSRHPYGRSAAVSRRRARRRSVRRRHRITTVLVLSLLVLGLLLAVRAALEVLEDDPAPSQTAAPTTAATAPAGCPEVGARPAPVAEVATVTVLNATGERGLAGSFTDALAERGFEVAEAANADQDPGPVEIRHAPGSYLAAVTVRAHLGAGSLVEVPEQEGIVVVLGAGHPEALAPADEAAAVLESEAPRPEGC